MAADDSVEHLGVASEVAREVRRAVHDVDDEVDELRIRLEEREKLHAGRKPADEILQMTQRPVPVRGASDALEDGRGKTLEDLDGPSRAKRRIAAPFRHRFPVRGAERTTAGLLGRKEVFGQTSHSVEAVLEVFAQRRGVAPRQVGQAREALRVARQEVGLGIADHLQSVLDLAEEFVVAAQGVGLVLTDPARGRQALQALQCLPHAKRRIPPSGNELAGLREELDLADAAGPQLDVSLLERGPVGCLVVADSQSHFMRVADRYEIEMAAPYERPQPFEEALARCDVARHGSRLDPDRTFPGAAERLVVVLGRIHRETDRRHRRIRPEPQIRPEDVAVRRDVVQKRTHAPRGPDERGAAVGIGVGRVPSLVEEANEIDVGRVVQLARTHLPHREDDHSV